MELEAVTLPGASPTAPLSLGIKAGGFLFISGRVPKTGGGEIPHGIAEQTRTCLENFKRVVEAGGISMDRVVKTTVFLTDMTDFREMNAVYKTFFPDVPPTRSTVAVAALARPGYLVEIEGIALL